MYKLLIVDDEDIEREGMAQFIPWSDYDVELVGTAWNGVDGYEQIQNKTPDIVITDIKMPVMNGIQLIQKVKEIAPDIIFIVLSGYGEYEFTSQAMEEGIRYYILKPCDEAKIISILEQVKQEIQQKREKKKQEKEYNHTMYKLLPRAREQLFRNMLLDREEIGIDYQVFSDEFQDKKPNIFLLAFRIDKGFDYLEQFVLGNVLCELIGEKQVYLTTSIEKDILFIIDSELYDDIENPVERAKNEFLWFETKPIQAAKSKIGKLEDISSLYIQIQQLFRLGVIESRSGLLHYDVFHDNLDQISSLIDYHNIESAKDYEQILFEIYLAFLKMDIKKYPLKRKQEISELAVKFLYGDEGLTVFNEKIKMSDNKLKLFVYVADSIADRKGIRFEEKEEKRIRDILLSIYENIQNTELNIQYLAKEVLFMNEDYFGRLFDNKWKVKFSSYLLNLRITLAQKLLQYEPELKIALLAEYVGYSPDGQYFSKAFRKTIKISPTEYRDMLKKKLK